MSTNKPGFTEAEVAAVTSGPSVDPEVEALDPAVIDEAIDGAPDLETPFEKVQAKGKKLAPEKVRAIVESLLLVTDKPLALDQL